MLEAEDGSYAGLTFRRYLYPTQCVLFLVALGDSLYELDILITIRLRTGFIFKSDSQIFYPISRFYRKMIYQHGLHPDYCKRSFTALGIVSSLMTKFTVLTDCCTPFPQ